MGGSVEEGNVLWWQQGAARGRKQGWEGTVSTEEGTHII